MTTRRLLSLSAILLVSMTLSAPAIAAADDVVRSVRTAIQASDWKKAEDLASSYRKQNGNTPEALEALSWMGRGSLAANRLDQAAAYAKQTQELAEAALKNRKLDDEGRLPIALGAAFEVQAQVLAKQGSRSEAVTLLQAALQKYKSTSIIPRLRKNLNLLTLEGKPAPAITSHEWIGAKPSSFETLKGKVVLVFLWAHWCGDCKAQAPILAKLENELSIQGFRIIGPTKRYGYAAQGDEAAPEREKQYISEVFGKYYRSLPDMPVPLDAANFDTYGASTTPTIVLIDRKGIVRLYHPGQMTEAELRAAIIPLLGKSPKS